MCESFNYTREDVKVVSETKQFSKIRKSLLKFMNFRVKNLLILSTLLLFFECTQKSL
jgi:hypothetical protein